MAAIALGMARWSSLGACKIPKSTSVNLFHIAPRRYLACGGLNSRLYASSTFSGAWHHKSDRYLTRQQQPTHKWGSTSYLPNGVLVRSLTTGPSLQRHKDPANEQQESVDPSSAAATPEKLGLFARFKKMYKEYWYVLVPVHCLTSVMWFGGFYYASTSGVDVIAILESLGVSEKLINPVRDSSLGHIAIAYLLYKIATPARYTVTLGGTTVSIKYLEQWGYIKPIPSKARLVQMYKDKKENIQEKIAEKKQDFQDRKQQLTEKKNSLMSDLKDKNSKSATTSTASSVTHDK
uniref:DUF1279 domain-containing protein n=1 Tax=Anopheles epiroticus TaxID=199890 RepID=A0A182PN10_9DIPT